MDQNNSFLLTLQQKEREIQMQLDALRTTIKLFQNGHSHNSTEEFSVDITPRYSVEIPKSFDEAETWRSRLFFVLAKIKSGFVKDIAIEMKKYLPDESEDDLIKRITQLASNMKAKGKLDAKEVGNRYRYFIK